METKTRLLATLSIIMLFFLTSCASTKLTDEWKDPHFGNKKFNKIMVIGVATQPNQRIAYEDEFVRQLKAVGVKAISSHTILPHEKMGDKAAIVHYIEGSGIDGVIITRLQGVQEKVQDYRHDLTMYDYYSMRSTVDPSLQKSGPIYKQKYNFETNLYDTKTEKLVFSLSSITYAQDNIEKRLSPYIKIVVNKLVDNKLI